jgi:mRNA-degrading endonuclease toxin of MazEF toxin-antitoxin module
MRQTQNPNYQPGDVVITEFPYPEGRGAKLRPALVVSQPEFPNCANTVIVLEITSSPRATCETDVAIIEWEAAGLDKPSIVRCFPATIHAKRIQKKIGTLSPQDWQEVCEAMRRAVACFGSEDTIPSP